MIRVTANGTKSYQLRFHMSISLTTRYLAYISRFETYLQTPFCHAFIIKVRCFIFYWRFFNLTTLSGVLNFAMVVIVALFELTQYLEVYFCGFIERKKKPYRIP